VKCFSKNFTFGVKLKVSCQLISINFYATFRHKSDGRIDRIKKSNRRKTISSKKIKDSEKNGKQPNQKKGMKRRKTRENDNENYEK
jgi:hypothetical protein